MAAVVLNKKILPSPIQCFRLLGNLYGFGAAASMTMMAMVL